MSLTGELIHVEEISGIGVGSAGPPLSSVRGRSATWKGVSVAVKKGYELDRNPMIFNLLVYYMWDVGSSLTPDFNFCFNEVRKI